MTEQEWLDSDDPSKLLHYLAWTQPTPTQPMIWPRRVPLISNRQARLFAVACCRSIWHLLTVKRSRKAVEVVERYADGKATWEEWTEPSARLT